MVGVVTPDEHDTQLLKGVLVLILLRLLDQRPSYGYELVGRVRDAGLPGVAEGSVYPALARLERDGHLTAEMVPAPAGPPRKYFHLSSSGVEFMRNRVSAWTSLVAVVASLVAQPCAIQEEVLT